MNSIPGKQQGQVIILFVLALVGLLAFAGLAIDGAMVYSDRRSAQNGADSAALAGAGAGGTSMQLREVYSTQDFRCADIDVSGKKMHAVKLDIIKEAISRASHNGYLIDEDILDNNGVKVECTDGIEKYLDVEVRITAQTKSSFLHLVFSQPLVNTVTAIARVRPVTPVGGGAGIIALDQTRCKQGGIYVGGIYLDGTTIDVTSRGGGMSSNTCIIRNGNSEITVIDSIPPAFARTSSDWTNDAVFVDANGNPIPLSETSDYSLTVSQNPPNCTGLPTSPAKVGGVFQPGIYPSGINQNGELAPGLYCIDIGAAGKIGNLTGTGVTLYIRTGSIQMSGSDSLKLYALDSYAQPVNGAVPGLVLYIAEGDFVMGGNSTGDFAGTIYVPKGTIDLGGASTSNTWESVLIGNNVKIHGNPFASLVVDYKDIQMDPVFLNLLR